MKIKRLVSFDVLIDIDENNDSIEVLADALGGDIERVAKEEHNVKVECAAIRIDGKQLKFLKGGKS